MILNSSTTCGKFELAARFSIEDINKNTLFMEIIIDTIGWIGSILLITAYWLNSTNKINAQSIMYQGLNIIGSICFIITTVYHKAYPPAALNVVWVLIGVYYLFKNRRNL